MSVVLCFHYACGRENQAQRLSQIGGNFLSSLGLSICLFAALRLCAYAVSALFFSSFMEVSFRLTSIVSTVSFFIAAPWLFLGRLPDETDDPESRAGFRKVTANLFLPFYLVLVGILLGYIVMILVRWQMPVGQMNGLGLTAMTLFAVFHLTLTGEENRISRWFRRWGAWLMLPVIAVQQVGVWMRFDAYGLTSARYAGMIITALLVLTIVWALMRRRANWFFIGAAAAALVLLASPLNVDQVPRWNQEARLKNALEACSMLDEAGNIIPNAEADEEHRSVIISSADYLRRLDDVPEGSFTARFQKQIEKGEETLSNMELFGFQKTSESSWEYLAVYGTDSSTRVNVTGYAYAEVYSPYVYFDDTEELNELILPIEQLLAAADWENEKLLQEEFVLEDGRTLRLATIHLTRHEGENQLIRINGWLLTPEN